MQLKQEGISVLFIKTTAKKELNFTIGIEKDFLCLYTLRLNIVVNTIRNDTKTKFDIHQANATISFGFLRINLGKGTLYHNLYCDIRINANKPSANGRISGKR